MCSDATMSANSALLLAKYPSTISTELMKEEQAAETETTFTPDILKLC